MIAFPAYPDQQDLGKRVRYLTDHYVYEWDYNGVRHRLTVYKGFTHDGASVPRFLWSFFPPEPLDKAAVMHDWLFHYGGFLPPGSHQRMVDGQWVNEGRPWSRRDADRLFARMLREDPDGPSRCERRWAYRAVRCWGFRPWDRRFV